MRKITEKSRQEVAQLVNFSYLCSHEESKNVEIFDVDAQQIATASGMDYIMVPGKQAKERLAL